MAEENENASIHYWPIPVQQLFWRRLALEGTSTEAKRPPPSCVGTLAELVVHPGSLPSAHAARAGPLNCSGGSK
jgi:hypothetical protein